VAKRNKITVVMRKKNKSMIMIRQAVEEDIPDLNDFEVIRKHRQVAFNGTGVTMPQFVANAVVSGSCDVAVVQGEIAGVIILDYSFFGYGFISLLITKESFRRQGVASRLMLNAEARCQTEKLFASTERSNHPMQALLDKLRYVQSGVVEFLDEEGEPELIYLKKLF
jgi:ribosomal protein S18 acetylase RimI-like enzyme